jgi:hypothetical protein
VLIGQRGANRAAGSSPPAKSVVSSGPRGTVSFNQARHLKAAFCGEIMATKKSDHEIAKELAKFVGKACPGVEVEVGPSPRWQRTCLTFRWDGFAGLLPEERFRLVAKPIPPPFFEEHCRGVVWLELADGESIEEYLALPRSEDIQDRLPDVWAALADLSFFAALEDELVRIPASDCPDDLSISKRVLAARRATQKQTRDAVLAFMRHEAYTDWEVLRKVRPIAERPAAGKSKSKPRRSKS